MRMVHTLTPSFNKKNAVLTIHAEHMPTIEMHQLQDHLSWFKKTMGVELKLEVIQDPEDMLLPVEGEADSALDRLLPELDADKPDKQA